ncbi:protein ANTAGONIST OF LIKE HETEROCHROMATIN PROTEIN 1-like [Rhizophagus clarus]|uniref:Protein ANTAGONIST OF LIKE HETEROCHROMATIN PROTEIN 1-like n=1 Tax=Rhizophagus clarus TaxID=94130 RepID=A0A8H3KWH2_9GLOM|nr:protein ANTAGONIST OF LIKE HETEROCHROMATIN PROTEIN 1-like [Rhizophagus clarus]
MQEPKKLFEKTNQFYYQLHAELNSLGSDNDNNLIKEILFVLSSSCYLVSQDHVLKSQHWYHKILSLYDNIRFKKVLRMERQQFNKLVQVLQNDTVFQNKGNKPQAPVEFQLVIFLRRLGSKVDILSICSRFRICEELSVKDVKTAIKLADCGILLYNFLEICGKIWEIINQNDDDDDNNNRYD